MKLASLPKQQFNVSSVDFLEYFLNCATLLKGMLLGASCLSLKSVSRQLEHSYKKKSAFFIDGEIGEE